MKRRVGISPVLVEMVFVLLFFALSATVVVQLLGAATAMSRRSRETSEALAVAAAAMETLLSDPAALARGDTQTERDGYTVEASVLPSSSAQGTLYTVDCKALKNGQTILSLQGSRFVGSEEAS